MAYVFDNALAFKQFYDTDIVADTDDDEIALIARQYGIEVVMRPEGLSGDQVTLDPVIFHATQEMERIHGYTYDVVMTMQATSPTLKAETVCKAFDFFAKHHYDTLISGVNDPHLSWAIRNGQTIPVYEKRMNRQQLPSSLRETGGFMITRRECVTENTRIGAAVQIYQLNAEEAIDIDSDLDWRQCEAALLSKKILIRADGEEDLGMGHIYRGLSLAYSFMGHDILFVTKRRCALGAARLAESNFNVAYIEDDDDVFEVIMNFHPHIVINDILDTSKEYVIRLKRKVPRVVNFEDKGEGAAYADATINALYESPKNTNIYSGFKYFFIRDEFMTATPKHFSNQVKNIVVLFGGTDPNNFTQRIYRIFKDISESFPDIDFHIVTGFGYRYKNMISDDPEKRIYIHNDVKRVSIFLSKADLAITSQGRTIFETACMRVPTIVLAQNTREMEHVFAGLENGFINLGKGVMQDDESIRSTVEWLINTPNVRRQMHELMKEKDFFKGRERVKHLILGEYDE